MVKYTFLGEINIIRTNDIKKQHILITIKKDEYIYLKSKHYSTHMNNGNVLQYCNKSRQHTADIRLQITS